MTTKANVLFVDDNKRVLTSMRRMFHRDFKLFLTTDGASAVKIATENSIDVIVADQRMTGMTGTEILGKFKKLSPRTVRILITGYADPGTVLASINIGEVFRFLNKPCAPELLRETLNTAVVASGASGKASGGESVPASVERGARASESERTNSLAQRQVAPGGPYSRSADIARGQEYGTETASPELSTNISSNHWQSATEVVMSGDSSEEIRPNDSATASRSSAVGDIGVVFFTIDSSLAEAAIRAVSETREVVLVTTLSRVIQAIEEKKAGVLVTDFSGNSAALQRMISALKIRLPDLVSIVVSGHRDTTDMINLINNSRVFRYLNKPVGPAALRRTINAAAAHHLFLRNHPELAKRHEAIDMAEERLSTETLSQFFRKIRSARSRR